MQLTRKRGAVELETKSVAPEHELIVFGVEGRKRRRLSEQIKCRYDLSKEIPDTLGEASSTLHPLPGQTEVEPSLVFFFTFSVYFCFCISFSISFLPGTLQKTGNWGCCERQWHGAGC